MRLGEFKTDCRQFRWDRPCAPHKKTGVTCADCSEYDQIGRRIAVVKLAAVGDVLRTTSLIPAIRHRYPGAWITWITAPDAVELFDGNESVDEVWSTGDPAVASLVRVQEFDAVLTPDTDPATVAVATALRAKSRVGFDMDERGRVRPLGEGAERWLEMGIHDPHKQSNEQTYQTLVAAALDLEASRVGEPVLEPSPEHLEAAADFCLQHGLKDRFVGINTGASGRWRYKRWTRAHQGTFIAEMTRSGVGVLLLGGPDEAQAHADLMSRSEGAEVVSAGTSHGYRQFAAFVEQCAVLVTGDTLALHVACARRVPVVALFGPTSSAEIELYGRGVKIAPSGLDCLGCYLPSCDVTPHCQERITPEEVVRAVREILD